MSENKSIRHNFTGVRTLVVGLAREGTAVARFLAEGGACVTVTDARSAEALTANRERLADIPVRYALGGHPLELLADVDILFVSPGVPLEIPLLSEARQRGLPLSSETRLFTRLCPAPVIGITGSSGKTTTTALVGAMLGADGRRTWVGGNIGQPLIGQLARIALTDAVVMELSSFQLSLFGPWTGATAERSIPSAAVLFDPKGWSPPIAAVLNVTPDHLDRHATMEAYLAAKSHILAHQRPGQVAILNWDSQATRELGRARSKSQPVLWFSLEQEVDQGAWLQGDALVVRTNGHRDLVIRVEDLNLFGKHNVANALAACALAGAAGASLAAMRQGLVTFSGVEHRLQLVRDRGGVRWYNDSIATTPERTVAALQAFADEPIILLAGGRDKHLPWEAMAAVTWTRARHVILFGEAAGLIERALRESQFAAPDSCQVHLAGTLERAVQYAAGFARPGDVVLLSPGGTSFDAYPDYTARGEHFVQLVTELE